MKEGNDLWNKYCSFFEKSFSEQVEYNEKKLKEHFEKWKKTKMAEHLCPQGVEKFEDVPLTTYEDYPILHEFGKEIERLEKTVPRKKGERLWDYYTRISKQVAPMLDGWLPDDYNFCVKTSGTGGESRWFAHSTTIWKNNVETCMAIAFLACSENWGETRLREGDRILAVMAPPPFGGCCPIKVWEDKFVCVPPPHIVENITDMGKKLKMFLKYAKEYRDFAFIIGMPGLLQQIAQYFTYPEGFYKDRYQSVDIGVRKLILFLLYLQAKSRGRKYEKASDLISVRGLISGAVDPKLYIDTLQQQYGIVPFNAFATTETLCMLMGGVERKSDLFPCLNGNFLEFIAENGEVKKIDELEKGRVYEIVATPFGSMLTRYKMGDLLRVIDFRDDGMPIFSFESRTFAIIDVYGYFKLSEYMIKRALAKAGLKDTENWIVTKEMEPKEHLHLLMEEEWGYSKDKASTLIFNALRDIFPDFQSYVNDFKIERPTEVIKVEYLKKGTFFRYTKKRLEEGVPFGQIKLPHIVPPHKSEIVNKLKRMAA